MAGAGNAHDVLASLCMIWRFLLEISGVGGFLVEEVNESSATNGALAPAAGQSRAEQGSSSTVLYLAGLAGLAGLDCTGLYWTVLDCTVSKFAENDRPLQLFGRPMVLCRRKGPRALFPVRPLLEKFRKVLG
jgi:hypothetical protein